jgi:hypothetical protein
MRVSWNYLTYPINEPNGPAHTRHAGSGEVAGIFLDKLDLPNLLVWRGDVAPGRFEAVPAAYASVIH